MKQFVLHNPHSMTDGMEVYPVDKTKELLDRVIEIVGPLSDTGKRNAGLMLDGRLEEVFRNSGGLKSIVMTGNRPDSKSIHLYIATLGKV